MPYPLKYWAFSFLIFSLSILVFGCTEIFSPDISDTTLLLNSPVDSLYTNDTEISFWWEQDSDIESFQLQITQGTNGNLTLLADTSIADNNIVYQFDEEGLYQWQVRGVNAGSESEWSSGNFFLDLSLPEKALAESFFNDTLFGGSDSLQWSSLDYPLEGVRYPTSDSLVIFRRNDSTTVGARYFFDVGSARSFPFSETSPLPFNGTGTYAWQVVTFDQAGNRNVSDFFKITVP